MKSVRTMLGLLLLAATLAAAPARAGKPESPAARPLSRAGEVTGWIPSPACGRGDGRAFQLATMKTNTPAAAGSRTE